MEPMERHQTLRKLFIDYVEGDLEDGLEEELTAHLDECPDCDKYLKSYRTTIQVTQCADESSLPEMPEKLVERLRSFLKSHTSWGAEQE